MEGDLIAVHPLFLWGCFFFVLGAGWLFILLVWAWGCVEDEEGRGCTGRSSLFSFIALLFLQSKYIMIMGVVQRIPDITTVPPSCPWSC